MKIYRVEHPESGWGPFRHSGLTDYMFVVHKTLYEQPKDERDKLSDLGEQLGHECDDWFRFAWESRELFSEFLRFKDTKKTLKSLGYVVLEISVEDTHCVVFSDGQVAYDPTNITQKVIPWNTVKVVESA